jgi:seryl-tRNA synthetase
MSERNFIGPDSPQLFRRDFMRDPSPASSAGAASMDEVLYSSNGAQELQRTRAELKALRREYSMNLERLDSLQALVQDTLREKAHLENSLKDFQNAWANQEASFQETIRVYCNLVNAEKESVQKKVEEYKQRFQLFEFQRQEECNILSEILEQILRSDKTPYLAFQQAYRRSGNRLEGFVPLKRLQQLCHKISIQQLAAEQRGHGVLRKKMASKSRSRSRGRKTKPRARCPSRSNVLSPLLLKPCAL